MNADTAHLSDAQNGTTEADNSNLDAPARRARLARIKEYYADLKAAPPDILGVIYHSEVVFVDPATEIHGLPAVRKHFARLLQNTRRCEFEFDDDIVADDCDSVVLFWRMTLATPPLNGGAPYHFTGASRLNFAGEQVIFHRDYFDLGAMLYERLPLVGGGVRMLKRRLQAQS